MEGATKSEAVWWYNGDTRRRNPTVEITLTPEQERIVRRGMASGRYATPEDLVGDALAALAEGETAAEYARSMEQAIEVGWAESERGELVDAGDAFRERADLSRDLRARKTA